MSVTFRSGLNLKRVTKMYALSIVKEERAAVKAY